MTSHTPLDSDTPPVPASSAPTPTPIPPRGSSRAVSIVTIVVGAIAILGTFVGTAVSAAATLGSTGNGSSGDEIAVDGVTDLDIDVSGGSLVVVYADVSEARLDTPGRPAGEPWTFERRSDSLRVSSPDAVFPGWGSGRSATLTLPRSLSTSALGAKVDVTGGALDIDGDFDDLALELAGGQVTLGGSSRSLALTVSGGSADVDLADVSTASFEVAGGEITARLSGSTPQRTEVSVTAGSADIALPDDDYRVTSSDGMASVDNRLRTSSTATAEVRVEATLGSITMRS